MIRSKFIIVKNLLYPGFIMERFHCLHSYLCTYVRTYSMYIEHYEFSVNVCTYIHTYIFILIPPIATIILYVPLFPLVHASL